MNLTKLKKIDYLRDVLYQVGWAYIKAKKYIVKLT